MRKPLRHQTSINSNDSSAPLIKDSGSEQGSSHHDRKNSDISGTSSSVSAHNRPLIVTRYKSYMTPQASIDQDEPPITADNGNENDNNKTTANDSATTVKEVNEEGQSEDLEDLIDLEDKNNGSEGKNYINTSRKHRRRSTATTSTTVGSRRGSTAAQKRQQFGRKSSTLTETIAKQLDFNLGLSSTSSSDQENEGEEKEPLNTRELMDVLYKRITNKLKREEQRSYTSSQFEDYFINPRGKIWTKSRCKEVFAGRRMRKMAFWFIVIFLAALTVKDVIELVAEYCENPKQSDINIRFNKTMNLPNITFCMRRVQAFSHFDLKNVSDWNEIVKKKLEQLKDRHSFLHQPWDYRLAAEGYQVISALSSIERETTSMGIVRSIQQFRIQPRLETKRKMIKMWMAELKKRQITFEEFTQKVGYEIFRRSNANFQRTSYDENDKFNTKVRTSWISEQEFCFQPMFHGESDKPITDQGYFFNFMTNHNAERLDDKKVDCMTVDFHGRPSSLTRYTQATAVNDGFIDDLCLGMWHEITVDVKALYEMLENNDEGTECKELGKEDENEFDCRMRCRLEMIKRECHCIPATLSYLEEGATLPVCDYTKCIIDASKKNLTYDDCSTKCRRSCIQIRYNVVHNTKGISQKPGLTRVDLLWGSFEYLVMKQDWVWSVTSFIAALGGSIGMWLGLSILSLIQGGTYLYAYLTDNVIKKKIGQRLSSARIFNKKESNSDLKSKIAV